MSLNQKFYESVFSDLAARQEKLKSITQNLYDFFDYAVKTLPLNQRDQFEVKYDDCDDDNSCSVALRRYDEKAGDETFSVDISSSGKIEIIQYYSEDGNPFNVDRHRSIELDADPHSAEEIVSKIITSELAMSSGFFVTPLFEAAINKLWTKTMKRPAETSPAKRWQPDFIK